VAGRRLLRRTRGGYELRLTDTERDLLRRLLGDLRTLLMAENTASDPAVARLFPPAYPDDLLENLDYERGAGHGLLADRLRGLDDAVAALDAEHPAEDQLMALLRSINDLRIVYGVKLDVTEETGPGDFDDERERATFDLYMWLGWIVQHLVEGL
jgi:hypothetical protein